MGKALSGELSCTWTGLDTWELSHVVQSVGHLTHGHILSFLLLLIQEGQLSVTGESMCTKQD